MEAEAPELGALRLLDQQAGLVRDLAKAVRGQAELVETMARSMVALEARVAALEAG